MILTFIHRTRENRNGRSQYNRKKNEGKRDVYTHYDRKRTIHALTNLPQTTHILWRRVKRILFFISPYSSLLFFCRKCH